jgi:hypothetical protein
MAAYQTALGGAPEQIGASRTVAGSVNAAIAGYLDSARFFVH